MHLIMDLKTAIPKRIIGESSLAPSKLQGQEFSIVTITEGRGGRKKERVIKKRNNEKKRKDKTTYE